MAKKTLFGLLAFAAFGFYACDNTLTTDDVAQVAATRLNVEELTKNYNYASVAIPKGFEEKASMLLMQDPTQATFGNFSGFKAGQNVNIYGVTNAKAQLGRVLFYDKKLSINSSVSCASCHHQDKGFADGRALSPGFEGKLTGRNSMSIVNPGMAHSGMFWDRREASIHDLSLRPVVNHIEMGMADLKLLEVKLSGTDYYGDLFAKAYPNSPYITAENISEALAAFTRSMVTWNARFDEGAKSNFSNFTAEELRGKEIFMGKQVATTTNNNNNIFNIEEGACAGCHSAPLFNDGVSQLTGQSAYDGGNDLGLISSNGNQVRGVNIGLDKVSKDKGVNNGSFKIPSLRNVELTGPYMHDGRFKTLEEVVDHYNEKVQPAASLHHKMKDANGNPKKLNLSAADKKALIAFMKTLTDKSFVNDSKYSNPFMN